MEMITYEFEGWVYGVVRNNWGVDLKVRAAKDDGDNKYPQHILFSTSKKSADKVPTDISEGDKVKVQFAPFLSEGVSKNTQRVYAINKNMLINIEVLEHAEPKPEANGDGGEEDMPF